MNTSVTAAVFGIDIGKNICHVVGVDVGGKPVFRAKFRRDGLLRFFMNTPPVAIGMESCPSSQWLARKLQEMGHTAKIIPAQFVKPFVKSNKNDTVDAEAIAEALTRPTMRFVQLRNPEQLSVQALHRVRDRFMRQRTGLINQIRGFLLEFGISIRQGAGVFKLDFPRILEDAENELPPLLRCLLADLWNDLKRLETRIGELTITIQKSVQSSEAARRLVTVPGIGPLATSALEAAAGRGQHFSRTEDSSRHGSVWFRGSIPPAASPGCWRSASEATHTCDDC
jgi:transposase